jgi:hypothetical protein
MNGMIMIARMIPADRRPDADRRTGEELTEDGNTAEDALQRLLHELRQDRAENEQAPHAIDDRRDGGQQLDRGAERALQPGGGELGQESAIPKLTGTAIRSAMAEVISVP